MRFNGELGQDFERLTNWLIEKIPQDSTDADRSDWISQECETCVPSYTGDLMTAMADNPNLAQMTLDSERLVPGQTLYDIAARIYADELKAAVTSWYEDEIAQYEDCPRCDLACHEDDLIDDEITGVFYCPDCTRKRTIMRAGGLDPDTHEW